MVMPTIAPGFDAALLRTLFDRVYIINLPERSDRRREMAAELGRVGLSLDDPLVHLFPAVRPADRGEFPSIGARGCFLSHLGVLKDAQAKGHRSILILEDDVEWTATALDPTLGAKALIETEFAFLHGGPGYDRERPDGPILLTPLAPDDDIGLTHFIGLRGPIIGELIVYLEAMLARPEGSPEGGPMHVDGAYCWFRQAHPDFACYVCAPSVAQQRPSRSDISAYSGWRAGRLANLGRKVRGYLRKL